MITFLMPPGSVPRGGNKYTIRMAEILHAQGHEVQLYEDKARPSEFFPTDIKTVSSRFDRNPDNVFVIPEDQHHVLNALRDYPQRKVVYCQNQYYAALGLNGAPGFSAFGVSDLICSSLSVLRYSRIRHRELNLHYIPYGLDSKLFSIDKTNKAHQIAFNPYKRPTEFRYIFDMFRSLYPQYRHWGWKPLQRMTERDTARVMGESAVFLSLNRLDSLGLMPLEAMLSGCVVAGFKGFGAEEYATSANGFWTREDDLDACVADLKNAVEICYDPNSVLTYQKAAMETASRYSVASFVHATEHAWANILQN